MVGIRELNQHASRVVDRARRGETIVVTDRGVPVAQITPYRENVIEELIRTGRAQAPRRPLSQLPRPRSETGQGMSASDALREEREADRR